MTIVKTSELTNLQIDWVVASIELKGTNWFYNEFDNCVNNEFGEGYSPSTDGSVSAMRHYVASKLGDSVEIPDFLKC